MFKKFLASLITTVFLTTGIAFADSTISALAPSTGLSTSDLFVIVHGGSNYKLTASQLAGVVVDLSSNQTITGTKIFNAVASIASGGSVYGAGASGGVFSIVNSTSNAGALYLGGSVKVGSLDFNQITTNGFTLSSAGSGATSNLYLQSGCYYTGSSSICPTSGTINGITTLTQTAAGTTLLSATGTAGRITVDVNGTGQTYIDGGSVIFRNFPGTNTFTFTTATGALSIIGSMTSVAHVFPSYNNTTASSIDGGGTNNLMRFNVNGSVAGTINGGASTVWNYPILATSVAGGSGTTAYVPPVYNHSGGATSNFVHMVQDYGQGSGSTAITINLAGNAAFSDTQSYTCHVEDISSTALLGTQHASGSQFLFTLSGATDFYNYTCTGF